MTALKFFPLVAVLVLMVGCEKSAPRGELSPEERAESLLQQMTLDEKIGQMIQLNCGALKGREEEIATYALGSVLSGGNSNPEENSARAWRDFVTDLESQGQKTRLKIPIIYGIDAVHGNSNLNDATIFPHNIGLGASRDAKAVEAAARVTAEEVAGIGVEWSFAPCVAVVQNPRWGRTYESFGEDPELVAEMGAAVVRGLQGDDLAAKDTVLSCTKHFLGDGGTTGGVDQGDTQVDLATLKRIHLPGYLAAIKAGTGSIMVSYSSWNGVKMHGHKELITGLLKGELGFKGIVISDYAGIDHINPKDYKDCVERSINAGIDMVMTPNGGAGAVAGDPNTGRQNTYYLLIQYLKELVKEGKVPMARIDDAVRRILVAKGKLGLFEERKGSPELFAAIGSAEHREVARDCVRKSMVLLQNNNGVLPLAKTAKRIGVAGRGANSIEMQCGGWTIDWQNMGKDMLKGGTTVLAAMKQAAPGSEFVISPDGTGLAGCDVIVAVIGEDPYAEYQGDRDDLKLSAEDVQAVTAAKATGAPMVTVLFSGRPVLLDQILPQTDALLAAWLPGSEGAGVADVLFGDYKPTGKLPVTWPKSMAQIPRKAGDEPQFPYGFGLSY